jgi:L-alanine-DL-glutamate epimerase-like enolase superfamily enzyme
MLNWSIEKIELPLRYTWKIAHGSTNKKVQYFVNIECDGLSGRGEVSLSTRLQNSVSGIENGFNKFIEKEPQNILTLESLHKALEDLELPNCLRFGIESAFVHYLSVLSEESVHQVLGLNTLNTVNTGYSLPILEVSEIEGFIKEHSLDRFHALKIKVDQDNAVAKVLELNKSFRGNIRIDANESFKDADSVIKFIEELGPNLPIEFLEQPMPADCHDDYLYLFNKSEVDIMGDESITDTDITEYHAERFHAINIKLQKAGGYLKAMKQIRDARELGIKTMLGCMIESTLGISSALNLAFGVDYFDLDSFLFLEKDPFDLVTEEKGRLFYSFMH